MSILAVAEDIQLGTFPWERPGGWRESGGIQTCLRGVLAEH